MPQLLIEFFSEEIPARMQANAEDALARALQRKLAEAGLKADRVATFSGPRRLAAVVDDLPAKAADVREERKGPRVGAPDAAVQGFLKSAGLGSIDQAEIVEDKKGGYYLAKLERAGRATAEIVAEIVPEIVRTFPWPKSMRSGVSSLQWVRPLHNVLCLFDGNAVNVVVDAVPSQPATWGHRFHAPAPIRPKDFADYAAKLRDAKVLIHRNERKKAILDRARQLCADRGLELVEDAGLLEEVAGLVEWPVVLLGDMDRAFLDLPGEIIRLSMRTHQKYFAVRDPSTGKLAPHFIVVANIEAKDGGKAIAAGNARVLSARLNDARFFWDTDRKTPLLADARKAKLQQLVFHQRLGSVWDKVERVKSLAAQLCSVTGADPKLVERAALLCKMDLVTETVGEFPELQGQVGRALAELEAAREHPSVAAAIEDHYRPLGPNDRVPTDPVAVTLALADKLDTLGGFWAIDEKPTGSSDAYGLRRAALGLVRIVLDNDLRFGLRSRIRTIDFFRAEGRAEPKADDLLAFLADRLKVQLRDQGKRHDLVDAVFALGDDDLVRIVARVEALDAFLGTEDGANLLAASKRAANILSAEEKKGKWSPEEANGAVDASRLAEPAEKALHAALEKALPAARAAVEKENFAAAMKALAGLRAPVDAFFDKVLVNAPEEQVRRNRLLLLSRFTEALSQVADFSRVEG